MTHYQALSSSEISDLKAELEQKYLSFADQGLNLDMTRGKPCPEQLDLSNALLNLDHFQDENKVDCRNYGGLDGLPAMKALFAEILEITPDKVIVGGNASLTLMFDALTRASLFGVSESSAAWHGQKVKFLCPSPGYDRHFTIVETLGHELIQVEMTETGPDMDQVEALVANDSAVKGIWCVPKYSNPTGISYSDDVVDRLASMQTAADDFRIMWDNAYAEHFFAGELDNVKEIISACGAAGNPDRAYVFASSSKISHPGSGVSVFASSLANIAYAKKIIGAQTIGPDKVNQLRHLELFSNLEELRKHMIQHGKILSPKFEMVEKVLSEELNDSGIADWTKPKGGYFTSLDLRVGSAKRAIELCSKIGVKLTAAGAPFPYGIDPKDCNIRIAPSFPGIADIETAMRVFSLCLKLSALEALLNE